MSVFKSDLLRFYIGVILSVLFSRMIYYLVFTSILELGDAAQEENISTDIGRDLRGGQLGLRTLIRWKFVRSALYKKAQQIALTASFVSFVGSLRMFATYDWWAVFLSDAVVNLTRKDRAILAGLRRMRLGLPAGLVCVPIMYDMQYKLHKGLHAQAIAEWLEVLTDYETMTERNPSKNGYFACIITFINGVLKKCPHFIVVVFYLLQFLLVTGRISYATYMQILSQILVQCQREELPARKVVLDFIMKSFF